MSTAATGLVLAGGRLVDPGNGVDRVADIEIREGRVAAVHGPGDAPDAEERLPLDGYLVVPGIIDPHVHVSPPFGHGVGLKMLARAGVTLALDLAGDANSLAASIRAEGCGINVGVLHAIIPGHSVPDANPDRKLIERELDTALTQGALGVKILGGHYPLTPEAMATTLEVARQRACHVAVHCGSTETGSDIRGLDEALELIGSDAVQVAHVNSYCRGQVMDDPIEEALYALRRLEATPVLSESYLAPWNGTSGRCDGGVPVSRVTRTCLRLGAYAETEEGLRAAILDGHASVFVQDANGTSIVTGEAGLEAFRRQPGESIIGFPVNRPEVTSLLAAARTSRGFTVTAFGSDGGSIPRNTTVSQGLALVAFGHLSLTDFVRKASLEPARMLRLEGRGSLQAGSHADVTVIDLERRTVAYTIVGGTVIYACGALVGSGGTVLTTDAGAASIRRSGATPEVVRHVA